MAFDLVLEKWVEFRQVEIVNKQNVKIGGKKLSFIIYLLSATPCTFLSINHPV